MLLATSSGATPTITGRFAILGFKPRRPDPLACSRPSRLAGYGVERSMDRSGTERYVVQGKDR